MPPIQYYIVSVKNTRKDHEHILFWGPDSCGYTPVVGDFIGVYNEAEAALLNDGESEIAVPVADVLALLSPEPYYKENSRFYDQRGPVVDNTRANWNALLAARLPPRKPKPNVFRGKRRSFALANQSAAPAVA